MANGDDYSDLLPGEPQPQSRWDVLNQLIPQYLKQRPVPEMPPPGSPPGKIGPPSAVPAWQDVGERAAQALPDVASWFMPSGKAAGLASKAVMAGPMARTANMSAYHEAMGRLLSGSSPERIFEKTGWFPRQEGQMAFEIPDYELIPKKLGSILPGTSISGAYADFAEHPKLFSAYPEMANKIVTIDPEMKRGGLAYPSLGRIVLGGEVQRMGLTPEQQELLTHETQHLIQAKEGWSRAPSAETHYKHMWKNLADSEASQRMAEILKNAKENRLRMFKGKKPLRRSDIEPAFAMYWNSPSEVESRNVQNRFRWGKFGELTDTYGRNILPIPERRFMYPRSTEDVPADQQFNFWKHIKPVSSP